MLVFKKVTIGKHNEDTITGIMHSYKADNPIH
jgi:hypothetical protein